MIGRRVWTACQLVALLLTIPLASFSSSAASEAGSEIDTLSLQTVLDRAAQYHPDIVQARNALVQAERDLVAQQAAYAPKLSLDSTPIGFRMQQGEVVRQAASIRLSANQSTSVGLSGSASLSVSVDDGFSLSVPSWNVSFSYPLFRSAELNSTNMAIRQAQIQVETARRNLLRAESTALVQTVELYHGAQRAAARWKEALDALTEAETEATRVARRVELGVASDIEYLTAQTELRRQQLQAAQAERAYKDQMQSLLTAIGIEGEPEAYRLSDWPELSPPGTALDLDAYVSAASSFDVGLWQREIAVDTARLQLEAEIERSGFETTLSASVGKGQDRQVNETIPQWSLQLQVSYPLADGGAQARALADREQNLKNAERAYEEELKAFQQRLRQLQEALSDAETNLQIAELSYEIAALQFAGAQTAHASGLSSVDDLKQAERALERAKDDLEAAVLDVYVALWNIQIAAGMRPDFTPLFDRAGS